MRTTPFRRGAPILLGAALMLSGCGGGPATEIRATGHVEAIEVRVAAKTSGQVLAFAPREGDSLATGDVLAVVDTVNIGLALDGARAERASAAAALRLAEDGARAEDIAAAAADVDRLQAELTKAQRDADRLETLLASGAATVKDRDDASTRRDAAAAALRAGQETLKKLRAGSRPEEIDAARARLKAADAQVAALAQQLDDAVVEAPVPGFLSEKIVEKGEFVTPGSPLAVLTNLDDAWLTVYVPEPDLDRIHLGDEARVTTDGGESRTGRITFIASEAEFTPKNVQTKDERVKLVYRVKIGLDNTDRLFKPGMPAEAVLAAGRS